MLDILGEYKFWRDIPGAIWRAVKECTINGERCMEAWIFWTIVDHYWPEMD